MSIVGSSSLTRAMSLPAAHVDAQANQPRVTVRTAGESLIKFSLKKGFQKLVPASAATIARSSAPKIDPSSPFADLPNAASIPAMNNYVRPSANPPTPAVSTTSSSGGSWWSTANSMIDDSAGNMRVRTSFESARSDTASSRSVTQRFTVARTASLSTARSDYASASSSPRSSTTDASSATSRSRRLFKERPLAEQQAQALLGRGHPNTLELAHRLQELKANGDVLKALTNEVRTSLDQSRFPADLDERTSALVQRMQTTSARIRSLLKDASSDQASALKEKLAVNDGQARRLNKAVSSRVQSLRVEARLSQAQTTLESAKNRLDASVERAKGNPTTANLQAMDANAAMHTQALDAYADATVKRLKAVDAELLADTMSMPPMISLDSAPVVEKGVWGRLSAAVNIKRWPTAIGNLLNLNRQSASTEYGAGKY